MRKKSSRIVASGVEWGVEIMLFSSHQQIRVIVELKFFKLNVLMKSQPRKIFEKSDINQNKILKTTKDKDIIFKFCLIILLQFFLTTLIL